MWKCHMDQLMAYKGSMGSEGIGGASNMTEDPLVLPVVPTMAAGVVMPEVVMPASRKSTPVTELISNPAEGVEAATTSPTVPESSLPESPVVRSPKVYTH